MWRKTWSPKKSGMGKTSVLSACWRQGPSPLCPWWKRELVYAACCCSYTTTGSEDTRVSLLSQLYPTLPKWLACCSFPWQRPQQGRRQAGKEEHGLEDLLHMSTRSSVAGGSWASAAAGARWAWVEPVYKDQFCVTGCGTQRDSCPVLCILTT